MKDDMKCACGKEYTDDGLWFHDKHRAVICYDCALKEANLKGTGKEPEDNQDEIRRAFDEWIAKKLTNDEAKYSEFEDELCFYAGYNSRDKQIEELEAKLKIAEEALEEIERPIDFIISRLKDNEKLNGAMAMDSAKDHNYLKNIAIKALSTIRDKI